MNDQIKVTQENDEFAARIDGIDCVGLGDTEAQAIRSLANILGDFARSRGEKLRAVRKLVND